jgi:RND family efflux transporter MFP subunit
MNKMKWTAAAIIIALLLIMNVVIFDKKETTAVEAPRLETILSKQKDFTKKWEVTGVAQSKNTFDIYQNPSLGSIKEIIVAPGETVTSGQTLVTYENAEIESELRSLKRDKEAADVRASHFSSQVSEWESELSSFDEEKDSADAKVSLQQQLADAELQEDLAENESSVLSSEITELEKKLDELSVKSPADGVVSEVNAIQDNEPILTIVGQGNFELKANIDQKAASVITVGDSVQIKSPDSNKKLNGTVQTILPADNSEKFTLTVLVEEESAWLEGQVATIYLSEKLAEKAVSVPEKSILKDNGKKYVLIISKNKLYRMKVSTGVQQNGVVEIKKGLKNGSAVVINPSPVFVSGQPAIKK